MLTKDAEFLWIEDCEKDFMKINGLVCMTLVLRGPDWALPFHIHIDASQTRVGVFLGHKVDKTPYEIYYVSKNLIPVELNYTVIEK